MKYDVIVVGAGAAGSVLAYKLAKQNLRVLLLEKAKLPRYKACGGGIPFETAKFLDFPLDEVVEDVINKVTLSFRRGVPFSWELPEPCLYMVMRDKFDYLLTRRAVTAGVELIDNCPVKEVTRSDDGIKVIAEDYTFRGQILVGADGVNSVVARAANLKAKMHPAAAIESEIEVTPDQLASLRSTLFIEYGRVPFGYIWIFPKAGHLSVGIGSFHPKPTWLQKYLQDFLTTQKFFDCRDYQIKGHLIPQGIEKRQVQKERVLLIGDAAGTADPFSGEGIRYAIKSALMAAESIIRALEDGNYSFPDYQAQVNKTIRNEFKYAYRLAWIVYSKPEFLHKLLEQDRTLIDLFTKLFKGEISYDTVTKHILRSPYQSITASLRSIIRL